MKALGSFVAAAALSALLQLQLNACGMRDCDCPRTPDLPPPQAGLSIQNAYGFTNEVLDELPIDPVGGTLDIVGDRVILRYEHEGQFRAAVYEVVRSGGF